MKTFTQLKQAMKAPMYRELTGRELLIYKTGFKNGYRMSSQQSRAKIESQLLRLKYRQERFEEKKNGLASDRKKVYPQTLDAVINKVCIKYEVKKEEVLGIRRFEFLVRTRSIIINLMIEIYGVSLSQLGRMLKIDHSTVLHHVRLKSLGQRFWTPEKTIHEEFKELKEELIT
tara:strand:+ start:553 stop:1071 length:519 start_codon:yes stop_codon:yes gene_type:complete